MRITKSETCVQGVGRKGVYISWNRGRDYKEDSKLADKKLTGNRAA